MLLLALLFKFNIYNNVFNLKGNLTQGSVVHAYETKGRDNYRTGQHRTVASAVVSACSSDAGVHLSTFYRDHLKMFQRLRR